MSEKTILISGGTGLIGSHLARRLLSAGHKVILLSRSRLQAGDIPVANWDPAGNKIDEDVVAASDVIIHLAGTNIGAGRWTKRNKRSILESRVNSAALLFDTVSRSAHKPAVFISASGVNYHGMLTSERIFTEEDPPGNDFLARVCVQWENAAWSFGSAGIRTVIFRNSMVLAPDGGIIRRLYLPFKAGFGVIPGTGRQYVPWIHINDLCSMYLHAIENETMNGVYNAVAPEHVNFKQFANDYARALKRKIILPRVPSVFLKIALGEMSAILLEGSRASCRKIAETGFRFQFPSLNTALAEIFKTPQ